MKNNLPWLIKRAGLTNLDFGKQVLDIEVKNDGDINRIKSRISTYCKHDKIPNNKYWAKMAEVLDSDYNEMFGYKN